MKRIALLGASGHGKVVADLALVSGWESISFFDDAWPACANNGRWPVCGDTNMLLNNLDDYDGAIVSIGDGNIRWQKHRLLQDAGARLITLIHPAAIVSPYATIGQGSVVMAGAVINVDTNIGEACIINTGATVDHDCRLGNAVHICPGANLSGGVKVGPYSWIGVGAAVKQYVCIGDTVTAGAGAVVVNDIQAGLNVIGNPARAMNQ